jgi:pimeloyl-ACP methyl ester carboxylesterase
MSGAAFVSVAGRRTRVRVEGNSQNPPVLLLHGVSRSMEDWGPQYPRLSGNHRLIALDLPGSGFSSRHPERTSLLSLAEAVLETLDALEETRPVNVVGNSLGGAVALQLLGLSPERVASLVLVNSAGFGDEVALPLRLMTVPGLGELLTGRPHRVAALISERLPFADPALVTRARVDHALEIARQPDTGKVLLETVRELASIRAVRRGWRTELFARATVHPRPTLVIWGDRDRVLPAHHLEEAKRLLPHAQTQLFTGIGHAPQIECPDEFAALVLAFLAEVHAAAGHSGSQSPKEPRRRRARPRPRPIATAV